MNSLTLKLISFNIRFTKGHQEGEEGEVGAAGAGERRRLPQAEKVGKIREIIAALNLGNVIIFEDSGIPHLN